MTKKLVETEIIIKSQPGYRRVACRDLWMFRELFLTLVKRDILVHYKQTFIGVTWVVLQPLVTMIIFTLVVGRFVGNLSEHFPYPLLVFCGLVPWQTFSKTLSSASSSIVSNQSLVTKVYFPRVLIPATVVTSAIIDIAVNTTVLILLSFWFYKVFTIKLLLLPVLIVFTLISSFFCSLWFAGLSVFYRDFQFLLAYFIQTGQFISPLFYPLSIIPEKWRVVYALNPLVTIIETFRWVVIKNYPFPSFQVCLTSFSVVVFLGWTGWIYFHTVERRIADRI